MNTQSHEARTRALRHLVAGLCLSFLACQSEKEDAPPPSEPDREPPPAEIAYGDWGDPFEGLASGAEQLERICSGPGDDLVRDVFCGETPPAIANVTDLQAAFGLGPKAVAGITGASIAGHSTSLSARSVSAINPRVIVFRLHLPPRYEFIALSYNRGDQFAEIAAIDRQDLEFRFYLVRFEQACNETEQGCLPGDLLTEAAETDWRNLSLYDEAALTNTVLDCATCHQPDGPGTPKMLRMQEFDSPWTHWFYKNTDGGAALIDDYTAAKGDESVGGLPRDQVEYSSPGGLELLVGSRNHHQPNKFDSLAIEREVRESAAQSGGNQPFDNSIPGTSPTWRAAYERAQRGETIPVPYHDVKVTDPDKLEHMITAYQAYRAGELARADLPDLRDVFPDDPRRLAAMGIGTEPGLSGEEVLIEACSMCHNERLDQSLSRARFRADLQGLSREQKDAAIARLSLPSNNVHAMPPARLRVLSPEARKRAIEALRR